MVFGKKEPDWKKHPILEYPNDFQSSLARRLLSMFQLQVQELPRLYEQLIAGDLSEGTGRDIRLATQTQMEVDSSNWLNKCKQLAAGAALNYEVVDRGPYRIDVGTISEQTLFGMSFEDRYAILNRVLPPEAHRQVADVYVANIQRIVNTFGKEY